MTVEAIQNSGRRSFHELLSHEMKDLLREHGTEVNADKGSILFNEGDLPEHVYYITKGHIRLTKTSPDGKVFFLQKKKQFDLAGELSLFNALPCQHNAEVMQDSAFIRFKRTELEHLLMMYQELSVAYMRWLSSQNQVMMSQFRDLVFCGKQGALFSILIRLSNEYGMNVKNGVLINRKITNQELANYVGATRESINRILKRLISQKILSVNTKYITIHNIDFLKSHLRCHNCPFEECTV